MLIAADGSEISWTALNMHDNMFLNVGQFQFMQEVPRQAILRIISAVGFTDKDASRIHRNLNRKLDGQLVFTIEIVDTIRLSARGKAIYVDQRIQEAPNTIITPYWACNSKVNLMIDRSIGQNEVRLSVYIDP